MVVLGREVEVRLGLSRYVLQVDLGHLVGVKAVRRAPDPCPVGAVIPLDTTIRRDEIRTVGPVVEHHVSRIGVLGLLMLPWVISTADLPRAIRPTGISEVDPVHAVDDDGVHVRYPAAGSATLIIESRWRVHDAEPGLAVRRGFPQFGIARHHVGEPAAQGAGAKGVNVGDAADADDLLVPREAAVVRVPDTDSRTADDEMPAPERDD